MTEPVNNVETPASRFGATRADLKRRVLDVEEVLSWAFREELPKSDGLGDGGIGPRSPLSLIARYAVLGSPIDNWSREPGFPAAMGPPHPDALLVEAALLKVAEETGTTIGCLDAELRLAPELVGLDIDEPAAMRVALRAMVSIVARCAKQKERPFWHARTVPRSMRHPNGHAMVVRWEPHYSPTIGGGEAEYEALVPVEPKRKDEYPFGAYCPLRFDPSAQSIAEERAEYLVWWGALDAIATELAGKLATIAVLPPAAAQRPWIDPVDAGKPPRIFDDLSARIYRREERETAAAHRMLGLRRSPGARGPARRAGAPVRAVRRPDGAGVAKSA